MEVHMMSFSTEYPKGDQNPKVTPLTETTSIPTPFICKLPPGKRCKVSQQECVCQYEYQGNVWDVGV